MSCCVIPKAKKSSSIKQLDQLRDYFDFVTRMNVKECVSNFVKSQS